MRKCVEAVRRFRSRRSDRVLILVLGHEYHPRVERDGP